MSKLLKKKEVVIGLGIALVIAIGFIGYLVFFKEDYKPMPDVKPQQAQIQTQHQVPPQAQRPRKNPSEIESVVGTGKPTLVFFHAGWCGHCNNAMPEWVKAAENLNQSGQFDAIPLKQEERAEEVAKNDVQSFPCYRLYPEGYPSQKFVEYKGDRSATSLLKFVHSEGQDS